MSAKGTKWDTPAESVYKDTKDGKSEAKARAHEKTPEGKAEKAAADEERDKKHPQPERH